MSRLAPVLLLLAGCAHRQIDAAFLPEAELRREAAAPSDAAAVVLYRADKTLIGITRDGWFTQVLRHVVTVVKREDGFWLAEVRLPFAPRAEVVAVRARVLQPDGTVAHVPAEQMLSSTDAKGDNDVNARFFRFPDVRLGSVLEYVAIVEYPWPISHGSQDTVGRYPVRRYAFEVTAAKPLVLEAIELNSTAPIDVHTVADGQHRLSCEIRDIPARDPEDFSPHWTHTEPRWAYRVVAYTDGRLGWDWLRDWKDVVKGDAVRLYLEDGLRDGFRARLDVAGCADVTCKVSRALAFARERTHNGDFEWDALRPLKQVLETKAASIAERGLLLQRLLSDAGVEAWFAFTTDKEGQQTAPTFPSRAAFDHLLVWLPRQPGLAEELYLDPHCNFCAPGDLTARHAGARVLVFRATTITPDNPEVTAEWRDAPSRVAPGSTHVTRHEATLDEAGNLSDVETWSASGLWAQSEAAKKRAGVPTDKSEREYLRARSPLLRFRDFTWLDCDELVGRCGARRRFDIRAYATPEEGRLLVPLTLMTTPWARTFDREARWSDVRFGWDEERWEEVVELSVPQGYRLVQGPAPRLARTPMLSASFSVEPTPQGARVRRTLARPMGTWSRDLYPELRSVAAVFKDARQFVLVFEKQ